MCIHLNSYSQTRRDFSLHYMADCYHSQLPNQNAACHPTIHSQNYKVASVFAKDIAALEVG